jgi:hypothetical protein
MLTHPSGVWIENELQICQSVEVKSTNDLFVEVQYCKPTNHQHNSLAVTQICDTSASYFMVRIP